MSEWFLPLTYAAQRARLAGIQLRKALAWSPMAAAATSTSRKIQLQAAGKVAPLGDVPRTHGAEGERTVGFLIVMPMSWRAPCFNGRRVQRLEVRELEHELVIVSHLGARTASGGPCSAARAAKKTTTGSIDCSLTVLTMPAKRGNVALSRRRARTGGTWSGRAPASVSTSGAAFLSTLP